MLNSKFDLYKTGWLDLVFADRNQQYGAYELRKHYGDNMFRAMVITFSAVGVLVVSLSVAMRHKPVVEVPHPTEYTLDPSIHSAVIKKPEAVKPPAAPKSPPVQTTKFVPFVVTDKPVVEEPPKHEEMTAAVGPVEIKVPGGDGKAENVTPSGPGGTGVSTEPVTNNDPVGIEGVQVLPEPVGGASAWAKFLQKNLRYPRAAQEDGVGGKEYVTFIVEKDGHLSNFELSRPIGHGFDEESLRVLKLAPAWKPGIQNNQPVRVRYTLPINFVLGDD